MLYPKNQQAKLSTELFKNPSCEYRGTPFWAWNGKLSRDELMRQIMIFKKMGLGGFHMHVRTGMDTPYLNDEFMDFIRFCIDTEGDLLLKTLKFRPFVIKPNKAELEAFFGKTLNTTDEISAAAKDLQNLGAKNVLVSLGGDGAILLDENGKLHTIAAHQLTPINTVGAGDSMLAGFLAGVDRGYDFALKLGNAAGAATAAKMGLAEYSDIEYYLNLQQ